MTIVMGIDAPEDPDDTTTLHLVDDAAPLGSPHNPIPDPTLTTATTITDAVILAWVAQLLSEDVVSLVAGREGQVEIRLFANRGKVRKNPTILLNAGPQEMV